MRTMAAKRGSAVPWRTRLQPECAGEFTSCTVARCSVAGGVAWLGRPYKELQIAGV